MLKLDFTGMNVLVTGAGRGLGKACALAYATKVWVLSKRFGQWAGARDF